MSTRNSPRSKTAWLSHEDECECIGCTHEREHLERIEAAEIHTEGATTRILEGSGFERPRHWFDDADRRGFTDLDAV